MRASMDAVGHGQPGVRPVQVRRTLGLDVRASVLDLIPLRGA